MKKPHRVFAFLFLLITPLMAQQSVLDSIRHAAQKSGAIHGITYNRDTGERLPFVNIQIKGTSWGTSSNSNGEFSIDRIPEGEYVILASVVGHKAKEVHLFVTANQITQVRLDIENENVQMNEIMVYGASLRKERITESPSAISVVEGRSLQRSAASGQLPKLLEGQPGVDLVQSGLYDFNLNTRGFNSSLNRRVLVLLDGRDLGTAFLSATEWNGMSTPLEDLGRVEMVRGPGSALYGANAYNGVMSITSLPPKSILGSQLTVGLGELNMYRGDIRHAGEIDRWSYKINIGGISGNTFSKTRFKTLTGNKNSDIYNATVDKPFQDLVYARQYFEYELHPLLNVEITEMRDNPVTQFYCAGRVDYEYKKEGTATVEGGITQVENEVIVTGIGRVQVQRVRRPFGRVSYSGHGFNVNIWTNSRINMAPEISLSTGLELIQDASISQGEVQYSTLAFDDKLFLVGGVSHRLISIDTKGTLMKSSRSDNASGIFGQAEYRFVREFKTVVAIRFDRSSLHESFVSPKAALVWSPFVHHTFRLTYNRAFQSPNYSELYLFVDHPFRNLLYRGNNNLKVEKIQGFEVGYNGVLDNTLFITTDVYFNMMKDFITDLGPNFNPALQGPVSHTKKIYGTSRDTTTPSNQIWSYTNVGEVNEYGYDIGLNYYLADELIVDANYSYFRFEIVRDVNNQIQPNSPRWKANAGITYTDKDNYDISLKLKYVPEYDWAAGVYSGTIHPYALVNVSAGYQYSNKLGFNLSISNIMDRKHYEIFGGSVLGRRSVLTATYSF